MDVFSIVIESFLSNLHNFRRELVLVYQRFGVEGYFFLIAMFGFNKKYHMAKKSHPLKCLIICL